MKKKWYESEWAWLLVALGYLLLSFIFVGIFLNVKWVWIMLPGIAYVVYFAIKGILYAFIINPVRSWRHGDKEPAVNAIVIFTIFVLLLWSIYRLSLQDWSSLGNISLWPGVGLT